MPLVSVIIPNYNHALYLKRRLDSIIGQTYKDIELIILDDCSTDNSRDIIEPYRNSPLVSHIIYNERNSGSTFKQWQKGIECAAGDYIWIAESDDWCEPAFLEELIPALQQNDKIVLAFCQTLYVSAEDKIIHKTQTGYLAETIGGHHFLKTRMLGCNTVVNASMAVFRKSKVALSEEYKEMKYCGDWLFWVNLCFTGDVYVSGKYLNYYLRHANNVASNATRQGYDFLEGNKIYHFITGRIEVGNVDRKNALNERAHEYLTARYSFFNEKIHKAVWASLLQLDVNMKSVIKKMIWKARIANYTAKLNKWLS